MKVAIISLGSKSSIILADAMKKYFKTVDMLDLTKIEVSLGREMTVLYDGEPIKKYDCVYAKGSYKYEQLLRAITVALKGKTYLPIHPNAFNVAHDKIYTQMDISQNKIPMPTTYLSSTIPAARNILKKVNYPIIMKFPRGTQGKGVMFADSFASASSILDALDSLKQPFLIQEYVETGGSDIRVFVIGDKVVASMKRNAEIGEKRANLHVGGVGEAYLPDINTKKMAIHAAKVIGAEICAVDILEDIKGPVVIEVNISPGLQGITEATEINVADKIAKYLFQKASEGSELKKKRETSEILKDINTAEGQDIIANLDLRGDRILLPIVATKLSKLKENTEVCVTVSKDQIKIKKFS